MAISTEGWLISSLRGGWAFCDEFSSGKMRRQVIFLRACGCGWRKYWKSLRRVPFAGGERERYIATRGAVGAVSERDFAGRVVVELGVCWDVFV